MKKAIILHGVEDAKHCVRNGLYRDASPFSTHTSVDTYLKEYHNINCENLSKFFTTEEIIHYKNLSAETIDCILNALDSEIAPSLNRQFGLKMRYFTPLYSYLGKHHFSAYVYFVEAIKRIINIYDISKILCYDCKADSFFNVNTNMGYLFSLFFPSLEMQLLKSPNCDKLKYTRLKRLIDITTRVAKSPLGMAKKALYKITNRAKLEQILNNRNTVLIYEDLYDLDFLKKALTKYNTLYYCSADKSPSGFKFNNLVSRVDIDFRNFDFIEDRKNPFIQVFLKDIREDFTRKIATYISGIELLRKINGKYPISLGVWGNGPISGIKTLVFEYLRSEGIKVLGAQHGCVYGDSFDPWQFDADFNRCDYFISYGFTREDLGRLYPDNILDCEIVPLGKVELTRTNKSRKKIDIVFPVTMNYSMFESGMIRPSPHKLVEKQIILLEYLNSLKNLDIYIKPLPNSTSRNCSLFPVLKRLKNLKVVSDVRFAEFLRTYEPRIVLMELPTQALYQSLGLDVEIFLIGNDVEPFEKRALEELKQRVHYSEDTNEIVRKLDLFLKGKLQKKRDNAFYSHYIYKKNTECNILQFIDSLVDASNKKRSAQLEENTYARY